MHSRSFSFRSSLLPVLAIVLSVNLLCGFSLFHKKKKYETPITKETMQPDKVLFDRAINNIEHGNYLSARLTLQTLINTYDTSEYLAKAKLAIADSWFREGDAHGLAQAEIEYKDFILFYPNMEEAAESQSKICDIHIKQMSEPDRDSSEAQRAEDECRQAAIQFPNSKFTKGVEQKLRNVQEALADKEFKNGEYYYKRGALPAAQGRFAYVTQQYPLYSNADEALWALSDSYHKMGDRFENQEADALTKIVRDYPLSVHVPSAKNRLTEMKRPVPQADAAAYDRMKYNMEHRTREGLFSRSLSIISGHPDMGAAAKMGAPIMTESRPGNPVSIPMDASLSPAPGGGGAGSGVSDVGIGVAGDSSSLDRKNDARIGSANDSEHPASVGANGVSRTEGQPVTPAADVPLPSNRTKKEIDEFNKRITAAAKAQKKAADAAAKKAAAKSTSKPGATAPAATPPGAAAPAGTTTSTPAAVQQ
jgi:outer membrane protein assembly factor BamD